MARRRTRNLVILLGDIGKDATTSKAGNADKTTFSLATRRMIKRGDQFEEVTDWHRCVMWNASRVADYLTKGTRVELTGQLRTSQWEGNDGQKKEKTEVVVDDLILLESGKNSGGGNNRSADNDEVNDRYRSEW